LGEEEDLLITGAMTPLKSDMQGEGGAHLTARQVKEGTLLSIRGMQSGDFLLRLMAPESEAFFASDILSLRVRILTPYHRPPVLRRRLPILSSTLRFLHTPRYLLKTAPALRRQKFQPIG
jgi:hypothetical protein